MEDSLCVTFNEFQRDYFNFMEYTQVPGLQVASGVLYALIFLCGMAGNLSIIISIAKRKRMRCVANMFLINLSMTQIVLCLTTLPVTPITLIVKEWKFGKIFCKIFPMVNTVTVLVISLSLCCIAIDRCVTLKFRYRHRGYTHVSGCFKWGYLPIFRYDV